MKDKAAAARIGVVLYDGVEPIDIGGTVGVVSMASRVLPSIAAVTIAASAGPVRLAGGLTVLATHGFADAPACDVLVVCGGPGWRDQVEDETMLAFLRRQMPGQLASVCTGALLSGLGLDVQPQEALVVDAGIVTGGGVSLAIDATLYLIG